MGEDCVGYQEIILPDWAKRMKTFTNGFNDFIVSASFLSACLTSFENGNIYTLEPLLPKKKKKKKFAAGLTGQIRTFQCL